MTKTNAWLRDKVRLVRNRLRYCREYLLGGGPLRERLLIALLGQHYESQYRRDWRYSAEPPHFFNHRLGMFRFAFGNAGLGPYHLYRGLFSSEVIRPGDRLLDIGCGDGFITQRFLAAVCSHVDALDIEPTAIAAARRRHAAPQIRYHLLDAVREPFPQATYDVIAWDGAIGHFAAETTAKMLGKIASALAPDGVFVGSESLGSREGHDHLQFFASLEDLQALLRPFFAHVQVRSIDYKLPCGLVRSEALWRCAHSPDRLAPAWRNLS